MGPGGPRLRGAPFSHDTWGYWILGSLNPSTQVGLVSKSKSGVTPHRTSSTANLLWCPLINFESQQGAPRLVLVRGTSNSNAPLLIWGSMGEFTDVENYPERYIKGEKANLWKKCRNFFNCIASNVLPRRGHSLYLATFFASCAIRFQNIILNWE